MVEFPIAFVESMVRKTGASRISEVAGMEQVTLLEEYDSKISMDAISQRFSVTIRRHNR